MGTAPVPWGHSSLGALCPMASLLGSLCQLLHSPWALWACTDSPAPGSAGLWASREAGQGWPWPGTGPEPRRRMELGHSQRAPQSWAGQPGLPTPGDRGCHWGQMSWAPSLLCPCHQGHRAASSRGHLPVFNAFHRRWPCPTRPGLSPAPARCHRPRWTLMVSVPGSLSPAQLPASSASCPELCAAPRASPQPSPAGSGPTALLRAGCSGQGPHGLSPWQGHSSSCSSERAQPQPWGRGLAKGKGGSLCALLSSPGDPESSAAPAAIPPAQASTTAPALGPSRAAPAPGPGPIPELGQPQSCAHFCSWLPRLGWSLRYLQVSDYKDF